MKRFLLASLVAICALFAYVNDARAACCTPLAPSSVSNLVITPAQYTEAVVLVANTSQTITVPAGANFAVFSADCNFWMVPTGGSLTVPAATTSDGSGPTYNPTAWNLGRGARFITVVAGAACKLSVAYYS